MYVILIINCQYVQIGLCEGMVNAGREEFLIKLTLWMKPALASMFAIIFHAGGRFFISRCLVCSGWLLNKIKIYKNTFIDFYMVLFEIPQYNHKTCFVCHYDEMMLMYTRVQNRKIMPILTSSEYIKIWLFGSSLM